MNASASPPNVPILKNGTSPCSVVCSLKILLHIDTEPSSPNLRRSQESMLGGSKNKDVIYYFLNMSFQLADIKRNKIMKPNELKKSTQNRQKLNIAGKMIFYLGSSVTYGSAAEGKSFVEYISERTDSRYVKEAVSGTTLVDDGSDSYIQRMLRNMDTGIKCDYFICQLSTNDAAQNKPLGSISNSRNLNDFDTATIIGAIEYIIAYVKNTWNCLVTFYTNTYFDNSNYEAMVAALYQIQKKWNIGIIDLWNNQAMRNVSAEDYAKYMNDEIHPTAAGYQEWWSPVFEEYLQKAGFEL